MRGKAMSVEIPRFPPDALLRHAGSLSSARSEAPQEALFSGHVHRGLLERVQDPGRVPEVLPGPRWESHRQVRGQIRGEFEDLFLFLAKIFGCKCSFLTYAQIFYFWEAQGVVVVTRWGYCWS